MTIQEQNKALILQYLDEVWSQANIAAADRILSPEYKRYLSPISEPLNLDGQKQRLAGFRATFPDVQITVEDMFAEGDRVVFRSIMRATHQGTFQGILPTGRQVTVGLLDIIRIENGKFIEHWGGPDMFDLVNNWEEKSRPISIARLDNTSFRDIIHKSHPKSPNSPSGVRELAPVTSPAALSADSKRRRYVWPSFTDQPGASLHCQPFRSGLPPASWPGEHWRTSARCRLYGQIDRP